MRPLQKALGCLMVAGAALDAAALTLLGLFLAQAAGAADGGGRLPSLLERFLNHASAPAVDAGAVSAAFAGAAFVYLMVRIVLGLLTGAVSLFGAGGRIRS
jgi:hypothetical protein